MKDNDSEERILDATMQVVSRYTISGTRMRLIAEEADITQSVIHYYFKSKDNLMSCLQQRTSEHCFEYRRDIRDQYKPDSLQEQIDIFIRQKLHFITDEQACDFVEMDCWMQTRVNPAMKESMSNAFHRWREEVRTNIIDRFAPAMPEHDKCELCYTVISLLQGASLQYHLDEFDLDGYFDYCKEIIVRIINKYS